MSALTQYGREVANPESPINQAFRPLACNCEETPSCQDKATRAISSSGTVTAFTYNGITTTLSSAIVVTNTDAIQAAISAVIEKYESNPLIKVEYDGTTLTIKHIGYAALTAVTTSAGAATVTRSCVLETVETVTTNKQGTNFPLIWSYNGAANSTATLSGTYTTINSTVAGTLKTDLTTALATPIGAGHIKSITVTADTVEGYFVIDVKCLVGFSLYIAGDLLTVKDGSIMAQFANS